ncbi:3-keto-disaccharide hydrolase [Sediminicola luteus]|uniref:3-keto-alpha-glucoside-1,2-lyase/3-keto-2-hydroxy-glucal hydratase domain-containing protein n=1 Tax=Sediminicola luteus TaxID=319238 RepID=A0A2A4G261_9FLAO|nr:DUF1080 domain-containing protein [Sediminicola luteus]PCE62767.1 hypothetical protein B7P33_15890 [Sediminicola luteus]
MISKNRFRYSLMLLFFLMCMGVWAQNQTLGGLDWQEKGKALWKATDSLVIGTAKEGAAGFLITENPYANFEISIDFKPDASVNSGIFLRCAQAEISANDCYEFNIWDHHPEQQWRTGAVVTRSSPLKKVHTVGTWNTYRIRLVGKRLQAWINEVLVIDMKDEGLSAGYIGLQAAATGSIMFKNLQFKIL